MDPNANLREQEDILNETRGKGNARLRELRAALRDWVGNGGFMPTCWPECPRSAKYYGVPSLVKV